MHLSTLLSITSVYIHFYSSTAMCMAVLKYVCKVLYSCIHAQFLSACTCCSYSTSVCKLCRYIPCALLCYGIHIQCCTSPRVLAYPFMILTSTCVCCCSSKYVCIIVLLQLCVFLQQYIRKYCNIGISMWSVFLVHECGLHC